MHSMLKMNLLKLGASLLVVGSMATTFVGQSAFAANPSCSVGITVDATMSSASCDMLLTSYFPASDLVFGNDAAATMPVGGSSVGVNNYFFHTNVSDDRGIAAGWHLDAASVIAAGRSGLQSPLNTAATDIPLSLTATGGTISALHPGGLCSGLLTDTTGGSLPLTTAPKTFVTFAPTAASTSRCLASLTTNGQYTIASGAPAGTYTGTITITLVNTAVPTA